MYSGKGHQVLHSTISYSQGTDVLAFRSSLRSINHGHFTSKYIYISSPPSLSAPLMPHIFGQASTWQIRNALRWLLLGV